MEDSIRALMAAMTRWEPLSETQARTRYLSALSRVSLENSPSVSPEFHGSNRDVFVQSLVLLRTGILTHRKWALRGAVEVAIGSGTLPLAQNLALRTVAEALGFELDDLAEVFLDRTGAGLPQLWDPADPAAWVGRDGGAGPAGAWDDAGPYPTPPIPRGTEGETLARMKALALLGLEEEATEAEIKRAFHRISKVHHPDHYLPHGAEAMREAEQAFLRIKHAYDFLMQGER